MDTFIRYALSLEYLKMNELDQSRGILTAIFSDSPDYLPTYYQLGRVLVLSQRPEEAISVLQKGIEIAKKQGNSHTLSELRGALLQLTDPE